MSVLRLTIDVKRGQFLKEDVAWGYVHVQVYFQTTKKVWKVIKDDSHVKSFICWSGAGEFEVRPNGTLWLFDDQGPQGKPVRCVILWDAPTYQFDSKHLYGSGRVLSAKNPLGIETKLDWLVL